MGEANRVVAEILLARHAEAGSDAALRRAITSSFERAVAAARADAPGVTLADDAFAAHVARWLRPDEDPLVALASLRLDHLWLACAAANGDAAAIAFVEARHLDRAIAALRSMQAVADEALQRAREILFVGQEGRPPRIADYAGRGDLAAWIRTTAMREGFALLAPSREVAVGDREFAGYALAGGDPAVELMKRQYGATFKQALADALAALPEPTRVELRRYYFEGLGLEQIAALEGVAASTVSRRLDKARRALQDETRRALSTQLRVGAEEVDSILRLLDSRLEVSRSAIAGGKHE